LLAQGDARAAKAGRRYLLRSGALNEAPSAAKRAKSAPVESAAERAARRLRGAA
jgi:hypothetical protein